MIRKARKDHLCEVCNRLIRYGEEYRDEESSHYIGLYRKISIHRRSHLGCRKPRQPTSTSS